MKQVVLPREALERLARQLAENSGLTVSVGGASAAAPRN